MSKRATGFSLLEVVLALAILVGSLLVLGQLVGIGTRSAISARELTNAQLLAESVMSEVLAGSVEPEPVVDVPIDVAPDWSYSINLLPTEEQYLQNLEITVSREVARGRRLQFSISRWIRDPTLELPQDEEAAATGL